MARSKPPVKSSPSPRPRQRRGAKLSPQATQHTLGQATGSPAWARLTATIGAAASALAVLALAGVGAVTLHPALLFTQTVAGPGVVLHANTPFDACADATRDTLAFAAIRADTGAGWTHHVYFAAQAPRFQALQHTIGGVRGALTFNRSAPPLVSQVITFRTPDFCADALHRDGLADLPLRLAVMHEIGHSVLRRAVGAADRDLPAWKREGFADHVAASVLDDPPGRCALLTQARAATDVDAAIALLDAQTRTRGDVVNLTNDQVWPADYVLSRALANQLLEGESLSVTAFAADARLAAEVYGELTAACG